MKTIESVIVFPIILITMVIMLCLFLIISRVDFFLLHTARQHLTETHGIQISKAYFEPEPLTHNLVYTETQYNLSIDYPFFPDQVSNKQRQYTISRYALNTVKAILSNVVEEIKDDFDKTSPPPSGPQPTQT